MAISRFSGSNFSTGNTRYNSFDTGYPALMAAPTATDGGTGTTVSVAFTAQTGATSYTALSSPGSLTGTGTSSPITVSGLTAGTAYTFQIRANNAVGNGPYSAASNSVTPIVPTSFESIASSTISSGSTAVTFTSIPATYYALYLKIYNSVTSAADVYVPVLLFNNDSAANRYRASYFATYNTSSSGGRTIAQSGGSTYAYTSTYNYGSKTAVPTTSNTLFINYTDTSQNRNAMNFATVLSTSANGDKDINNIYWNGTAAINRIDVSITLTGATPSWGAGNVIALYGIKGS